MDYYLPTTLKMVKAYRTLGERNVSGAEAVQARKRIDDALGIVLGVAKLLDNLYRDDVLDITTDIDVLEQMLKRDGLTEGELALAAEQARKAAAIDAQVKQATARPMAQPAAETHAQAQTIPVSAPIAQAQTTPAASADHPPRNSPDCWWRAGQGTDVADQVRDAVAKAQIHAPQARCCTWAGRRWRRRRSRSSNASASAAPLRFPRSQPKFETP